MSESIIARARPDASPAIYGGKAVGLSRLQAAGHNVPAWFVMTPRAFALSPNMQMTTAVAEEVAAAVRADFPGAVKLAVRSSAAEEDSLGHSFAGQFSSYLNVDPADVAQRVMDVWRSAFTPEIAAYRKQRGITSANAPAVIVQRMVQADAAGVIFTADPVTGATDTFIVNAVSGLGDRLVAGEVNGDTYTLAQDGMLIAQALAGQTPILTPAQLSQLATSAARVAHDEKIPQDIEWAIEGGTLYLLQARPITTLAVGGTERVLWDNSNIVESYSGVTTPLTFSFAGRAYDAVYRELAMVLGVSPKRVEQNSAVFRNMIGLVRGRIYYNLLNWYRALAMLPGFQLNRRYMETMMGVDRALPRHLVESVGAGNSGFFSNLLDGLRLAATALGLIWKRITLARSIKRFLAKVDTALGSMSADLSRLSYQDLAAEYRRIEAQLLRAWTPPLVNDLWCMIAFGAAKGLSRKWAGDENGALLNAVLTDQGGIVSAEPPRLIAEMGRLLRADPQAMAAIARDGEPAIRERPQIAPLYAAYIARFGDRCVGELKLESATLRDDPAPLIQAILAAAQRPAPPATKNERAAMQQLTAAAGKSGLRRSLLAMIVTEAKARVRDRENLRFERTRVFGRARRIFVEMGKRLEARGIIAGRDDVFYLTVEEFLALAENAASTGSLKAIIEARRAEFDGYRAGPDLPRRFETVGAVGLSSIFETRTETAAETDPNTKRGLGCSAGLVRGRARIVRDPHGAKLDHGDILIAEFTDPGWITVFANCAALAVERGSLLSHSAIVARELGIPAVVGVSNLLEWVKDGELIELDGAAGTIRKLPANVVAAKPKAAE